MRPESVRVANPSTVVLLCVLMIAAALAIPGSTRHLRSGSAPPIQGPRAPWYEVTENDEPDGPEGYPGAAHQLGLAKRIPDDADLDTPSLYRAARESLARMPRFSSRTGEFTPHRGRGNAGSTPIGWPDVAAAGNVATARVGATPIAEASLDTWIPLGPGNIGGRTRVIVIDPNKPSTIYAGGVSGGIWKTNNGGLSWRPQGEEMANIAVNSMAMHPNNSQVLYAGTGEGYFRAVVRGTGLPLRGGGVFKTTDGGDTWNLLESTDNADFHFVNKVVFSPAKPMRLYAATRTGVWRTKNGGRAWKRILDPQVNGGCLDLAIRTDRP